MDKSVIRGITGVDGHSFRVEDLSEETRKGLVGARVVACHSRAPDEEFDKFDIGIIVDGDEDFPLWVNFDRHGTMGLFPDENFVLLSPQELATPNHVCNEIDQLIAIAPTMDLETEALKDLAYSLGRSVSKETFDAVFDKVFKRAEIKLQEQENE
jgi:hypothetical protein